MQHNLAVRGFFELSFNGRVAEHLSLGTSGRSAANFQRNLQRRERRAEDRRARYAQMEVGSSMRETMVTDQDFLAIPNLEERQQLYANFYRATSNDAVRFGVCAVCARRQLVSRSGLNTVFLSELPHRHLLRPGRAHPPGMDEVQGYLLLPEACRIRGDDVEVDICEECMRQLQESGRTKPPMLSLANGMWIGRTPWELRRLTLPEQLLVARAYPRVFVIKLYPKNRRRCDPEALFSALQGNATTYPLNMDHVVDMISGMLMPQPPKVLAEVLSVTYMGVGKLPKRWLKNTFRVRRRHVADALQWLKEHNPKYYGDVEIDEERLQSLPEDDVPDEILATVRQDDQVGTTEKESAGYIPRYDDEDAEEDTDVDDGA